MACRAYFEERDGFFENALEHYNGSVYYIHGLQDWTVDPHMAFDQFDTLKEHGIETKGLFGQWAHNYPDRLAEQENCDGRPDWCSAPTSVRHNWAQDLLEWFDHYHKEEGEQPKLYAEVQGDQGYWRIEDTYPPEDTRDVEFTLDQADKLHDTPDVVASPGVSTPVVSSQTEKRLGYGFDAICNGTATRIVGMPTFHVQVTPTGPGGQLFARLVDGDTGQRLGHAVMDLRYHEGGNQLQPVTPGLPITAKMQFQAMDVVLPANHSLVLQLETTGLDYMEPAVNTPVEIHTTEDSMLTLPVEDPTDDEFFFPPGHGDELGDGIPPDADGDPSTAFGDES